MTLTLTPEQTAAAKAVWQAGCVLIAKIGPETFDGTNHETSGTLRIEFRAVPSGALPGIREAIARAKKEASGR